MGGTCESHFPDFWTSSFSVKSFPRDCFRTVSGRVDLCERVCHEDRRFDSPGGPANPSSAPGPHGAGGQGVAKSRAGVRLQVTGSQFKVFVEISVEVWSKGTKQFEALDGEIQHCCGWTNCTPIGTCWDWCFVFVHRCISTGSIHV